MFTASLIEIRVILVELTNFGAMAVILATDFSINSHFGMGSKMIVGSTLRYNVDFAAFRPSTSTYLNSWTASFKLKALTLLDRSLLFFHLLEF